MVMPEENGDHHYIEESASVYLVFDFDVGDWRIDTVTVDGHALDSPNPEAPFNGECECADREACDAAKEQAAQVSLPNAEKLVTMLQDALSVAV